MPLRDQVNEDMKAAMKARETDKLAAIRLLLAAMKQREVDERITLSDADVLAIIDKMIKQRKDSITQFQAGGRNDLVAAESAEVDVLSAFLPQQLSDAEVGALIEAAIAKTGAAGIAGMGKVMAELKPQIAGRADMGKVSGMVKARLS
jgi:uncharacterized protein YqeY